MLRWKYARLLGFDEINLFWVKMLVFEGESPGRFAPTCEETKFIACPVVEEVDVSIGAAKIIGRIGTCASQTARRRLIS
ncbi:MAG: hypothetical protein HS122_06255 [Opitutaceae bacterium]|nr:hypothetical protein [Opitutaceae bacterium]